MRLWIAVHLPQLPLEVFCPNWSREAQVVVLEHERILTLTPAARASGLRPGMRHASVPLLLPEAQVHVRAPEREAMALHDSAMALLQYTPLVTLAEHATLLLDIGASLRLFGGIRALCRQVRASIQQLGLSIALSCAPTARGAWLLAQGQALASLQAGGALTCTPARCLKLATLARQLARLPVALLPPLQPFLPWLAGIGCDTLDDLRRLPRAGLQRRCGKAVLEMLDCAHGQAPELFEWIETAPEFKARVDFFERTEHTELLIMATERLLTQMSGWLCARHLAVQGIELALEHERGRAAIEPTVIAIQLGEASSQPTHLLRLLKERVQQLDLIAPVMAVLLEALQVQTIALSSDSLFPEPGGTPADYQRLLELLIARLGNDNVLQAQPQSDHRPEQANHWATAFAPGKVRLQPQAVSTHLPRPCWLLTKPIALLLREHRPFYGSPLKLMSPPERIESGWWQGELVLRDYFVAQGHDSVHYWIYRERLQDEARWYLHGLFG